MAKVESISRALQLRGEIAALNIPIYIIASVVGIHPGPLGQMLLGRVPLPADMAQRIEVALTQFEAKAAQRHA
jgi:DNA-binding transcriptional regulator YdaS (Cro superfamily)